MRRVIRFLSVLLCVVMVFSLCACGGNTNSGTMVGFDDENASMAGGNGNATSTGTAGDDTVSADVGGVKVESKVDLTGSDPFANIPKYLKGKTITFAHYGDEGATEYQKLGASFEKKTGIKVKWVSYNQGEYVAMVAKQINGGAAPDIIICTDTFPSFLEIAQPLQDIIDLNDDFWDDNIVKLGTVGKNSYMVNSLESVWNSVDMVFYNKQIFSSNGLTNPSDYYKAGKWSYENLKKCMEDVVKAGKIGGAIDSFILNNALGTASMMYDADKKQFYAQNEKSVEGMRFVSEAYKEGLWSGNAYWGTFASGNIGLFVTSAWGTKYNGWFKDIDDNVLAAVPLPTSYKGKTVKNSAGVRGYGIAKGSNNPEAAAYFLRYYLDYEYYDDAGANVFKNKSLENVYFNQVIPQLKKTGVNYDFSNLDALYGANDYDNWRKKVERGEPAQVATEVTARNNVVQEVVKKANEKLSKFK